MKKFLTILSVCTALSMASGVAEAGEVSADLQAVLAETQPAEDVSVIIQLVDGAKARDFKKFAKKVRRTEIVKTLKAEGAVAEYNWRDYLEYFGGKNFKNLWIRGAIAITVPAYFVDYLSTWSGIASVRLDATFSQPGIAPAAAATPTWNIADIGAPTVWQAGADGAGAVVAIIDTGVDTAHLDLGSRWRGGTNSWYDPNGEHETPFDADGHGTGVLGLMVGGDATGFAIGVAPGAQWIGAKLFNDAGNAQLSNIDLAFQWVLDPDGNPATDDAPDVVNNSWNLVGTLGACDPILQQNIQTLKQADIAVVFAAGNDPTVDSVPANYPETFAVGSVNSSWNVSSFSARGPSSCDLGVFPNVVAPGEGVMTSGLTYGVFTDQLAFVNGTSFAAPHVAGAMALLRSAKPDLTVDEMQNLLQTTARDLGTAGSDNSYGYGLLDVATAYAALPAAPPPSDADSDGFVVADDCNDNDPAVYPGAPETPNDGIDQSCNGYDQTLAFSRAEYDAAKDRLVVFVTTVYGDYSDPNLPDTGAKPMLTVQMEDGTSRTWTMAWKASNNRWQRSIGRFDERWSIPRTVTVSAPEGTVSQTFDAPGPVVDSIAITTADYNAAKDRLIIIATTDMGAESALTYEVSFNDGTSRSGNMAWKATKGYWQKSLRYFNGAVPVSVTVSGPGGSEVAAVTGDVLVAASR